MAGNRIFLHEFSAQSTIIIVIYMKEAINAPIVESLLSNQDKIPSLLSVSAQWFRVSPATHTHTACMATRQNSTQGMQTSIPLPLLRASGFRTSI